MLVNSIFFFSYNVFYSILLRITILATADLSSANALNLVMSKNLSLGKELKKYYPNSTLQKSHVSIRINHNCVCWLVSCIEVLRHFNSKGHIMAVGDTHVFPGFLTLALNKFLSKVTDYFSHMLQQR